ncbi:hypothetical protein HG531_011007 [Fusarium graminearum]|nr:hypothetical protein HG531_011007 [Fusarium graminearum]
MGPFSLMTSSILRAIAAALSSSSSPSKSPVAFSPAASVLEDSVDEDMDADSEADLCQLSCSAICSLILLRNSEVRSKASFNEVVLKDLELGLENILCSLRAISVEPVTCLAGEISQLGSVLLTRGLDESIAFEEIPNLVCECLKLVKSLLSLEPCLVGSGKGLETILRSRDFCLGKAGSTEVLHDDFDRNTNSLPFLDLRLDLLGASRRSRIGLGSSRRFRRSGGRRRLVVLHLLLGAFGSLLQGLLVLLSKAKEVLDAINEAFLDLGLAFNSCLGNLNLAVLVAELDTELELNLGLNTRGGRLPEEKRQTKVAGAGAELSGTETSTENGSLIRVDVRSNLIGRTRELLQNLLDEGGARSATVENNRVNVDNVEVSGLEGIVNHNSDPLSMLSSHLLELGATDLVSKVNVLV